MFDPILKIKDCILEILNQEKNGNNPARVRIYEYNLKSIIISILADYELSGNIHSVYESLSNLMEFKLIDASILSFYKNNEVLFKGKFDFINQLKGIDISSLYEDLLKIELVITDDEISFSDQKVRRDVSGAYYTPSDFAEPMVELILNEYFKTHEIKDGLPNIIDPSCGCGEFLCIAANYLISNFELSGSDLVDHLYGVDVDPLALLITKMRIMKICNSRIPNDNFRLGNLLIPDSNVPDEIKINLFAQGRIYARGMGIWSDKYLEKFDIIIGNPPWEKIKFEERKFFTSYDLALSQIPQKNNRCNEILKLKETNPSLYSFYYECVNDYVEFKQIVNSKNYPLTYSLHGELNTYSLFSELIIQMMSHRALSLLIVKSSIATTAANSKLFTYFLDSGYLKSLYLFDNSKKIFDIDSREHFCVEFFSKIKNMSVEVVPGLKRGSDLLNAEPILINKQIIKKINPDTCTLPNVLNRSDLEFLVKIHERCPCFKDEYKQCKFGRLVHLTNDSSKISTESIDGYLPILEGKMIWQYDSHYASFEYVPDEVKFESKVKAKRTMDGHVAISRYFIEKDAWANISHNYTDKYSLYWRSLTSSTNYRTMVATIELHMPTSQSIQLIQIPDHIELLYMLGLFNSKPFDYILRMKLTGIDLTQKIINQMPVPPPYLMDSDDGDGLSLKQQVVSCVLALLRKDLSFALSKEVGILPAKGSKDELLDSIDNIIAFAYGMSDDFFKTVKKSFTP